MGNDLAINTYIENLSKKITDFFESEETKKAITSLQEFADNVVTALSNVDWEQVSLHYKITSQIVDNIPKELEERQIDISVMDGITLPQALEMYELALKQNITFGDLVEDNLKLFNGFYYHNALNYLNILEKRKNRSIKDLNFIDTDFNLVEHIKGQESIILDGLNNALIQYKNGEIKLNDNEKNIIEAFKYNPCLKNKHLAKKLDYSESQIEKICADLRAKFNMDYFNDKTTKRISLILLSLYIQFK